MVELNAEPGHALKTEDIAAALQEHKPAVLFLCQGESSTGVQQSLAGVCTTPASDSFVCPLEAGLPVPEQALCNTNVQQLCR